MIIAVGVGALNLWYTHRKFKEVQEPQVELGVQVIGKIEAGLECQIKNLHSSVSLKDVELLGYISRPHKRTKVEVFRIVCGFLDPLEHRVVDNWRLEDRRLAELVNVAFRGTFEAKQVKAYLDNGLFEGVAYVVQYPFPIDLEVQLGWIAAIAGGKKRAIRQVLHLEPEVIPTIANEKMVRGWRAPSLEARP